MNSTTRNIVIGVVVVIILVLIGYFLWQGRGMPAPSSATTATSTTTSSTSTGVAINVSNPSTKSTGGYTITQITPSNATTPPNYKKPLSYSVDVSADEQAQDQSEFEAIQASLASDPTNYSAWIGLGTLREMTGDYQGAATDWTYVTEIYPSDPTAFANLGDLYANYLKQPAQGVTYYKDAIKLDPIKEATFYENLAQIYVSEGDTADAKATLQQGINAQVVGYQNLQTELSSIQ